MEVILRQDTGELIEVRPDGWQWGSKETDGSVFAIVHVTEEWAEGDWMAVRPLYDQRNEDGTRVWSLQGTSMFNNGVDSGLTLEYTTLHGTVPSGD